MSNIAGRAKKGSDIFPTAFLYCDTGATPAHPETVGRIKRGEMYHRGDCALTYMHDNHVSRFQETPASLRVRRRRVT